MIAANLPLVGDGYDHAARQLIVRPKKVSIVTEHPSTEEEIKQSLKLLSRGLMLPDYSAAYEGYRKLYILGKSAIEPLKKKVRDVDWSKSGYKEVSRYVSGLFGLIHDIDEDEAKAILGEMISTGCPIHIRAQMKSICNFSQEHYWKYKVFTLTFSNTRKSQRTAIFDPISKIGSGKFHQKISWT